MRQFLNFSFRVFNLPICIFICDLIMSKFFENYCEYDSW